MAYLRYLVIVSTIACTSRGHVDVIAFNTNSDPSSIPATGAQVIFIDPGGSSRTTTIDDTGHAEGEIAAGGTVALAQHFDATPNIDIAMHTDVQPGDTV